MSKRKILQLITHLGGGMGSVSINWVREDNKKDQNIHTIACLEKTLNAPTDFKDLLVEDDLYNNQNRLKSLIEDSDLVVVNWYNHPLMYDILVNFKFPNCRLICYNHVSSLNPPYNMPENLLRFFDKVVFTTNATYESDIFPSYSKDDPFFETIESAFGTEKYIDKYIYITDKTNPHPNNKYIFKVGYFGTSSYSKLDKNFVSLCKNVNVDNIKFLVASGDSQEHIKEDAKKLEVLNKFDFLGRVPDIVPLLKESHVFGYPLQPKHLGSAEQVFGEMMIFGVVPVVMNNPAERYIIDGKNGILANTYDEYSRAIEYLYRNPDIRHHMSMNAHLFAKKRYSIERKISKWNKVFDEIFNKEKKERNWNRNINLYDTREYKGSNIFLESIGDYSKHFINSIHSSDSYFTNSIKALFQSNDQWYSDNKGGVKQYLKYFPNDKYLLKWEKLLHE